MALILVVSQEGEQSGLTSELVRQGYALAFCAPDSLEETLAQQVPNLVILDWGEGDSAGSELHQVLEGVREASQAVVIVLVPESGLPQEDTLSEVDDFVIKPYRPSELTARVRRCLGHEGSIGSWNILKVGDLEIDLDRYQVAVAGHPAVLTFKEYELLRFLAANPGKVFSREVLLSRVWGYEYFGGDRTVDVHIRRLRSKIEDRQHYFIETVRNVGYRFRMQP